MVERNLAKVKVAGSRPVFRSNNLKRSKMFLIGILVIALVVGQHLMYNYIIDMKNQEIDRLRKRNEELEKGTRP